MRSVSNSGAEFASSWQLAARALMLALVLVGCGDGGEPGLDQCNFSPSYLPFEPGNRWSYQVTNVETGIRTIKEQSLAAELVDDSRFPGESFIAQTTIKSTGTTVSKLQRRDDAIVRFVQEDFDDLGMSERETVYEPGKLRLDETDERVVVGASYDDRYTATIFVEEDQESMSIVETWTVVDDDAACDSPLGQFRCLHLRRTRTEGGSVTKDFFFAPGIGKVREEGPSQLEELIECGR